MCYSSKGTKQLNLIDGPLAKYHKILDENLLPSDRALRMDPEWVLQHDSDQQEGSKEEAYQGHGMTKKTCGVSSIIYTGLREFL